MRQVCFPPIHQTNNLLSTEFLYATYPSTIQGCESCKCEVPPHRPSSRLKLSVLTNLSKVKWVWQRWDESPIILCCCFLLLPVGASLVSSVGSTRQARIIGVGDVDAENATHGLNCLLPLTSVQNSFASGSRDRARQIKTSVDVMSSILHTIRVRK